MRNTVTTKPIDRGIAALGIALISVLGCPPGNKKLSPATGLPQYQERAAVPVPGAVVNPLGGNLLVRRTGLSIDTHLGTREIGAAYNSASEQWLWSFDTSYDGASFVDPTGAFHDTSALTPGDAIPGTVWVVVDADTVKTKGGLAHEFAPDSRLSAVHYTSAEYPRLAYTAETVGGASRTIAIDQCMAPADCETVFAISYGADGEVASISDRAGRLAEIQYSGDRLVSVRDALDTARGWPGTRYEYEGTQLTAIVNSEGERVEYAYSGRRVREVRAVGEEHPLHRFDYYVKNDAGLYATRYVDPLGHPTWFRYDPQRRLHELEAADADETLHLAWDASRVAVETQPSGVITRWTYRDDDVATEVQPTGNVVHFSYAADAVNRDALLERAPLEVIDSLGLRERRSYDAAGRLVTVENGEAELVASYSYATDQTVASLTTVDGVIAYGDYGAHGHPTLVTSDGVESVSEYDLVGNLRRGIHGVIPELGGVVSREYDEDRNLSRITVADAGYGGAPLQPDQHIEIEHRSDGRRTRIARPGGGDHEFDYDALGRLIQIRERVDGAWASTCFEYDAVGRLTATELANGMRREAGYDAVGRIASLRNLRDGLIESAAAFDYADGQLQSVQDSVRGGIETYSYDGAGRAEMIEYPDGEVLVQHYDLRSRKTQEVFLTDSLLRWLDRGYDLADRAVGLSDSGQPVLQHAYQNGKLVETRYGSGLVRTYSYDPSNGLLDGSRTEGPGGVVEDTAITREGPAPYRPGHQITAVTTTSGGVSATTTEQYALAPPIQGWQGGPVAGARVYLWLDGSDATGYEYDALSNGLGSSAYGESFEYNAEGNRLLSATTSAAGTIDYGYDEAGFVTSRRGVSLTWTASGRLTSFGLDVVLEWDALDRKVHSAVMGAESRWLFGGRVQADPAGLPGSIDLGEVRVDLAAGQHRYRHLDFRGNVKFVSDQQGQIQSHYHYDAYGLRRVFGSDEDPVRFAGRSQIGELMTLGARIYDPAVGRFLSPDPVLQDLNQYAYTLGNPLWFADPSGRDFEAVLEGILASGGLALATVGLFFVASATGAVLAGATFGLAGLGFAIWVAHQLEGVGSGPTGAVFAASGLAGPRHGGGTSGAGQSCSPVRLASVPGLGRLHWLLIALQVLLAPLLIRSWSARGRRRSR
jgi:RHS repeat-associated protein